jgi:hypothetical protein
MVGKRISRARVRKVDPVVDLPGRGPEPLPQRRGFTLPSIIVAQARSALPKWGQADRLKPPRGSAPHRWRPADTTPREPIILDRGNADADTAPPLTGLADALATR